MATPVDAEPVICALRLGWAVSELRGRLRPGAKLIEVAPLGGHLRDDHALPLGGERTVVEQLIESEAVVCSLAAQLELDVDINELTSQAGKAGTLASQRLLELAKALSRSREDEDGPGVEQQRERAWDEMADFLYLWDAKIQDQLAGGTFSLTSGYQLGRGLGEITWLDPAQAAPNVATSWTFVLGDRRVATLKRLAERLADYFQPIAARGVSSSLDVWHRAAGDDGIRDRDTTRTALVAQTKRWRDLLLTGLDPITLLPPDRFLARARQLRSVLKSFWPELVTGGGFAVLAALGAASLASAGNHDGLATLISILGALGVTTSTLLAKAKNQAHDLVGQLRTAFDTDLVLDAVTVSPFPEAKPWWKLW